MPEPLALEMLAAVVPDHDVRIFDMRIDEDLTGTLEDFAPDMVAVTALTTEVYAALREDTPADSSAVMLYSWLLTEEGQNTVGKSGYVTIR